MISLFIILCLFIHNSRSKHSRKATVGSVCATVDFVVLEVFSCNNLLSEAVVGLKLFHPKSFRKKFFGFLKAPKFI